MPLYFTVCVGCADKPQGVTGESGSTWENEARCVLQVACTYVPHNALWVSMKIVPLGRENEKCCEVCLQSKAIPCIVCHTNNALLCNT